MFKKKIGIAFIFTLVITLLFNHSPLLTFGQTAKFTNPTEEQTSGPIKVKYQLRTSDYKGEYYFYSTKMHGTVYRGYLRYIRGYDLYDGYLYRAPHPYPTPYVKPIK